MTRSKTSRDPRNRGFTLVEMVVVTALLGIVSALAVPKLLAAKLSANETAVVASLRTLANSSELYRERRGTYPGAVSGDGLADLADPTLQPAPLIDDALASGQKHGYTFTYIGVNSGWNCVANPTPGSGFRSFYVDHSGIIRVETDFAANGAATLGHPALD